MGIKGRLILLLGLGLLASCTAGNCRRSGEIIQPKLVSASTAEKTQDKSEKGKDMIEKSGKSMSDRRVFVYKYDKSEQCNPGTGITLKAMARELKGIKIYSQENRHDGLSHIQVCGSSTGKTNVYEIGEEDLEKAKSKGFREWAF